MACTPIFEAAPIAKLYNPNLTVLTIVNLNNTTTVINETTPYHQSYLDGDFSVYNFSADPEFNTQNSYQLVEKVLFEQVILMICLFGILGNVLNLVILTRKSLSATMERMELSAHMGLLALAISDMLFCLSAFPHAFADTDQFEYESLSFWLIYSVYGHAVINIFLMLSTWLTVAMAFSRYLAICYPLKARQMLGVTFGKLSILVVFASCVVFNLPRFWMFGIDYLDCQEGGRRYFGKPGELKDHALAEQIYMWLYFVLGIVIPLIVLVYCTVYLVRALKASTQMRRAHSRSSHNCKSKNIVTLTLSVIVIMYIILVIPAELLNFFKEYVVSSSSFVISDQYNLAVAICNTLQAVNFAFNFILYCIINAQFRKTIQNMCCGRCIQSNKPLNSSDYQSMSQTGPNIPMVERTYNSVC